MGFGFFATFLILSLVFRNSFSQEPNTDGFYVSAFFTRMGKELHLLTHGFPSPICSWSWVSCDAQMNHVISLFASGLNLSGPIPDNTIGKLTKLQALDLSNNGITGFSADFWGLGGSLISLNLSRNMIDGLLSNNIGNFGRLESLDLSYNNFSGEIPVAVGSLLCLKILNLSGNGFEGVIPHGISGCKSLTYMDVSMNKLYGTIPDSFGAGFYNMRGLNLSFNFFQGSVAGVFQGPLEIVDLSNNQFQGYISKVNSSSSFNRSSLIYLDLSSNQFSGEFFTDLSRAQSLKHLDLAFNRFSHQNLSNITNLSHLKYLNLSRTNLVGRIPIEISNLSDLSTLDLSHNSLSGLVPDLNARNLRILDLSSNNLTGEIPVPLQQQLPDLQRFNFSYNNLTFCPNQLPPKALNSSFIGSRITCPIAAEPDHIITNRIKRRVLKLALAILLTAFFLIAALICLAFGFFRAPRTSSWEAKQLSFNGQEQNFSIPLTLVPVIMFEKPLLNFNFTDLLNATSNLDRETLLSEGRYGLVYGGFLPGGIRVAVKVLVHSSTLNNEEVLRELERLGRIKHPNLVSLMGYCLAGDQRITIYEYMENGNLENLLHDLPLGVHTPDIWERKREEQDQRINTWRFRHKVALGIARALAYLHHGCFPQIVHRDVKASSVYLDSNFEPRLSDFGLEKVVGSDFDDEVTKGSSSGYIAPEFFESGVESQTSKSDVYGFGVILFELITGKKAIGDRYPDEKEKSLVGWGRALVKKNQGLMAIDPKIRRSGSEKQMEEALRIAYLCTADLPLKRPSMQQIVGLLKDLEPIVGDQ